MKKKMRQPERRRIQTSPDNREELLNLIESTEKDSEIMLRLRKSILHSLMKMLPSALKAAGLPEMEFQLTPGFNDFFTDLSGGISNIQKIGFFAVQDDCSYGFMLAKVKVESNPDNFRHLTDERIDPEKTFIGVYAKLLRITKFNQVEQFVDGEWVDALQVS